ncbi:hypothetical protein JCM11641_002530 [Rhodosporidiobolus odoratus]
MAPRLAPAIAARLDHALRTIHQATPRLIASPPVGQGGGPVKRASVAIIIRLRPQHPPPASSISNVTSPTTSPFNPTIPLHPSPPSTPPQRPPSPTSYVSTNPESLSGPSGVVQQLDDFFQLPWVRDEKTSVEILYIKRASRTTDRWSGHCAFPGGRTEPDDESAEFTALRETWEEVGLDLAEKDWISIGQLDDREITTSLGKRLLMILSPFVFLHTSPYAPVPELQESEVASAHWIPIELLYPPAAKYGSVPIDIATRLAPRNRFARGILKMLMGQMDFACVHLPNDPVASGPGLFGAAPSTKLPDISLWGLTYGMTLDLLSHMSLSGSSPDLSTYPYPTGMPSSPSHSTPSPSSSSSSKTTSSRSSSSTVASDASIFPRFSHPDINLLIFLFSFRYRRLLRHPSAQIKNKSGGARPHGRVNWAGVEAGLFYAAVRKALVVAVVLRATAVLGGVAGLVWWVRARWFARR